MIKHVYAFKHEKANYFLKPDINEVDEKTAVVSLKRDLVRNNVQYVRNGIQECSFYCLGTFDDETGIFMGAVVMLYPRMRFSKS